MPSTIKLNPRLQDYLGSAGIEFLRYTTGAIERLLPHAMVSSWQECSFTREKATCPSDRRRIDLVIAIREDLRDAKFSLKATVTRRKGASWVARTRALDTIEQGICRLIVERLSKVLSNPGIVRTRFLLDAVKATFDEGVIATRLQTSLGPSRQIEDLLSSLRKLAEQTYENKPLTLGCVLDPNDASNNPEAMLSQLLKGRKKLRALTDGYRTAYLLSSSGNLNSLLHLEPYGRDFVPSRHYYPDWAHNIAAASRSGRCGICLTKNGDILILERGTLRFTYRRGRWQYWNHTHIMDILHSIARVQHVNPKRLSAIIATIYRTSLNVSFRHTGGMFVILRNDQGRNIRELVRQGDAIGDSSRKNEDKALDAIVEKSILAIPRAILTEVASLDGAIIINNAGQIRAYAAVLRERDVRIKSGSEGSRTRAAVGASNYGLVTKISSEGDITVFSGGRPVLTI